ncbi:MAG: DUF4177 domain-containing protein [Pseudomonadota bacterium]
MPTYEYKVVPAPEKAPKVKGLKGAERFAHAVETLMTALGADGWQYVRADSLPETERSGLAKTRTTQRNLLIFRRESKPVEVRSAPVLSRPKPTLTAVPLPPEKLSEEDEDRPATR